MKRRSWKTEVSQDSSRRVPREEISRERNCRRGAAVVELAVTSPLLVLILLGVTEYSQFANTAQIIGDASRRGARYASRDETTSVADIQSHVRDFVTGALPNLPDGSVVSVQVVDGSGASIAGGDLSTIPAGSTVMVDVSLNFATVRWLNYFSSLNGQSLQATTYARRE